MPKKKFLETGLGRTLLGAASIVSPQLANVLEGVTNPKEALAAIGKSEISNEEKLKLQEMIFEQQNKEIEAVTLRWQADQNSDSWLSKNVRPLVLIWCIVVFSFAGLLDSIDSLGFTIHATWNDTFEKVMMVVILAYFGGRTTEKATSVFKKK